MLPWPGLGAAAALWGAEPPRAGWEQHREDPKTHRDPIGTHRKPIGSQRDPSGPIVTHRDPQRPHRAPKGPHRDPHRPHRDPTVTLPPPPAPPPPPPPPPCLMSPFAPHAPQQPPCPHGRRHLAAGTPEEEKEGLGGSANRRGRSVMDGWDDQRESERGFAARSPLVAPNHRLGALKSEIRTFSFKETG